MTIERFAWLGLALGASGCMREEPAGARGLPAEGEEREELRQATLSHAHAIWELEQEPEFSAADRALLEEYAAIQALYAQREDPSLDPGGLFGLRTRDHELWFHSTEGGRRYTVKDKSGCVLAEQIDDVTLRRDFPELHDLLHHAVDAIDR